MDEGKFTGFQSYTLTAGNYEVWGVEELVFPRENQLVIQYQMASPQNF